MKTPARAALFALLICTAFTSCARGGADENFGNIEYSSEGEQLPPPAPYAERDMSYSLTVSDGKLSVTLNVTRTGGVSEAEIVSPEKLSGVHIVSDAEGIRITPPSGELLVTTDEASVGLGVFFDVMAHVPDEGERDGVGMYSFSKSGFDVTLLLSEKGMPRLITVKKDGVTRHGEVTFTEDLS